jgi:hypothetical protein
MGGGRAQTLTSLVLALHCAASAPTAEHAAAPASVPSAAPASAADPLPRAGVADRSRSAAVPGAGVAAARAYPVDASEVVAALVKLVGRGIVTMLSAGDGSGR